MVDHTNFLKGLRENVIVDIPSKYSGVVHSQEIPCSHTGFQASEISGTEQGMEDDDVHAMQKGVEDDDVEDGDIDSDFHVEDGDDELFLANTDNDVNDNNE